MYRIKYNYNTGDSFEHHENLESYLEVTWNNLDIVKDNLRRIKEHYEYYRKIHDCYLSSKELKKFKKETSTKDWYSGDYDFCLLLKVDNGNTFQIQAPWCGYFESLNSVEIVSEDPSMKISFRT